MKFFQSMQQNFMKRIHLRDLKNYAETFNPTDFKKTITQLVKLQGPIDDVGLFKTLYERLYDCQRAGDKILLADVEIMLCDAIQNASETVMKKEAYRINMVNPEAKRDKQDLFTVLILNIDKVDIIVEAFARNPRYTLNKQDEALLKAKWNKLDFDICEKEQKHKVDVRDQTQRVFSRYKRLLLCLRSIEGQNTPVLSDLGL